MKFYKLELIKWPIPAPLQKIFFKQTNHDKGCSFREIFFEKLLS